MSNYPIDQLDFNPWPEKWYKKIVSFFYTLFPGVLGYVLGMVLFCINLGKVKITTNHGIWKVVDNGWFGRMMSRKGWAGFSFGWAIFIWTEESEHLLLVLHEWEHVLQLFKYGFTFLFRYVNELRINGYIYNKFEVAARSLSKLKAKQILDLPVG